MSKRTPGPWRYDKEPGYCSELIASHGETVAMFYEDPSEADARLIAAAPDLLEALRVMRDADEDCKRDGLRTLPAQARAMIDAAIAKAEGGEV